MLYFSYGHDLNYRSVVEWYDLNGARPPLPKPMKPAIATNHRLAFPMFSAYWQGGVAGLMPEPGKRVPGGLLDVTPDQLAMLGEFNARSVDPFTGRERGEFRMTEITVTPYGGGKPLRAVTFVPAFFEDGHVAPTRLYLDRLVEAALDLDLSAMWVMHLRSVIAGPEETSEFFPGRAESSLSDLSPDVTGRGPAFGDRVRRARRGSLLAVSVRDGR